jgi:PEP-CTERM motif
MASTKPLNPWIASHRLPSFSAIGGVVIAIASASQVSAAITFVDAVHGVNTLKTGSTLVDTTWVSTANNSTANNTQWVTRSTWGNGGTVYQSVISSTANFPEITTQITGLTNGTTYDIWAFFWDNITTSAEKWILSAGLTTGALSTYSNDVVTGATTTGVVNTNTLTFSNAPVVTQTVSLVNYNMFGVKLGQVVVTGGAVNVYVDRNILGASSTQNRVWYDGVGFEAIPEPSASLLGGLGLICLLRRRRN